MLSIQTQNNYSIITPPQGKLYSFTKTTTAADNLLMLLLQKKERGFSILYDNYADALFSIIIQIVETKETAEDLLQDTFVKIWRKIDTYNETKGTLYTWMLNIARNTGIDFIRSKKNHFYKFLVKENVGQKEYMQPGTAMEYSYHLDIYNIKTKAALLEKKYAVVIELIYFEGYSYKEVAALLKLPLGTVKTRGRMALTILKKACK